MCLDHCMIMIASAASKESILNDWDALVVKAGYQSIADGALAMERKSSAESEADLQFSAIQQAIRIHAFVCDLFGVYAPLPTTGPTSPRGSISSSSSNLSSTLKFSSSSPFAAAQAFYDHIIVSGSLADPPESPLRLSPVPLIPAGRRKLFDLFGLKQIHLDVTPFPHVAALLAELRAAISSGPLDVANLLVRHAHIPQDLLFSLSLDHVGEEILHFAAFRGLEPLARFLLALPAPLGLHLHHKDSNGWTPLLSAASAAHWGIVKLLIDAGASVLAVTNSGSTTLHYIARHAQQLLPPTTLRNSGTAASAASKVPQLQLSILRQLLDVGSTALVNTQDSGGETALHQCCSRGLLDVAQLLLQAGAAPKPVT